MSSWRQLSSVARVRALTIRFFATAMCVFAALSFTRPAAAYCRTVTEAPPATYNPSNDGCFTGDDAARLLYWHSSCVGYSLQKDASRQVTLAQAKQIAAESFDAWSMATCDAGGNPSIHGMQQDDVDCDVVEYNSNAPNQHVIVFRDTEWPYNDPNNTLGLTTVTFDKRTGEIYDADMEINATQVTLSVTEPADPGTFDLKTIITHEAGHFFGLAHSPDTTATMFAHYHAEPTPLANDDVLGICDVYAPDGTRSTSAGPAPEGACDATPRHGFASQCGSTLPAGSGELEAGGGCNVSRAGARGGWAASLALALGWLVWRRTRLSLRSLVASAVAVVTMVGTAWGNVSIAISFDDLVRAATGVAVVTPVEQKSQWEGGRIYTYTRVSTDRLVAGEFPQSGAWIKTMGGIVGDIGQVVEGEPALTVGRPSLLFLEPDRDRRSKAATGMFQVSARAQGQFAITLDQARIPILAAVRPGLVLPRTPARPDASRLATEALADRTLEDASRDIASAWPRLHSK